MVDQTLTLDDQNFLLQAFKKMRTELGSDVHYKYNEMIEEMERKINHLRQNNILSEKPKKIAVNQVIFEMQS